MSLRGLGILAGAIIALSAGAVWYSLWLPGTSYKGPAVQADASIEPLAAALRRHVEAIASVPHNVANAESLERSARYIEATLGGFGYRVERQGYPAAGVDVRNIWVDAGRSQASSAARPWLVLGAHYDSFAHSPGANDNGSGAAALVEIARLLRDLPSGRRNVRLVWFVNEEMPFSGTALMGSRQFVRLMQERRETVAGMISLETIGAFYDRPGTQRYPAPYGLVFPTTGNFVALVGMPGSRDFLHEVVAAFRAVARIPSIGGIAPSTVPGIAWSDHKSFADESIPAIMITDTAPFRYPHYHRASDTPDKLDYLNLARVTSAVAHAARAISR